jgi:hypothetical protein
MWARGVDPRDTQWEDPHPAYRVYFWRQLRSQDPRSGWESDEWEIGDADVDEVLSWARNNAQGRRFVIYVSIVNDLAHGPGLVRLLGSDPLDE